MKARPLCGDVYWVALDPALGTEIRKTRPAVIVSNDSEALIGVKGKPGRALGDQIRSIDKARLRSKVGRLSQDELVAVDDALRITLGLAP